MQGVLCTVISLFVTKSPFQLDHGCRCDQGSLDFSCNHPAHTLVRLIRAWEPIPPTGSLKLPYIMSSSIFNHMWLCAKHPVSWSTSHTPVVYTQHSCYTAGEKFEGQLRTRSGIPEHHSSTTTMGQCLCPMRHKQCSFIWFPGTPSLNTTHLERFLPEDTGAAGEAVGYGIEMVKKVEKM